MCAKIKKQNSILLSISTYIHNNCVAFINIENIIVFAVISK